MVNWPSLCVATMFHDRLPTTFNSEIVYAWDEYILTAGRYWTTEAAYGWIIDNADHIRYNEDGTFRDAEFTVRYNDTDTLCLVFEPSASGYGIEARVLELNTRWPIVTPGSLFYRINEAEADCARFWDNAISDEMDTIDRVLEHQCCKHAHKINISAIEGTRRQTEYEEPRLAAAMAFHPRLGKNSQLSLLSDALDTLHLVFGFLDKMNG